MSATILNLTQHAASPQPMAHEEWVEKMDELRERMKGVRGVEEIRKFRKESLALIARRPSPNK